MKIEHGYDLYCHNTMRLHCIAKTVYFPENTNELVDAVNGLYGSFIILSGGSNVILPAKLKKPVIVLTNMNDDISISSNRVKCSASVRIQKLIRAMQAQNLGGMEYLYSVPCTVGGAVYMNAGRGEIYHQSISDFVVSVECFDPTANRLVTLSNDECQFSYRHSAFSNNGLIILNVELEMNSLSSERVDAAIRERIALATQNQDASKPSSGSVFKYSSSDIMKRIMGVRIGGACWSEKAPNWISNDRNASYWQVILLIKIAQLAHKLSGKSCTREVIIVK